MKHLSGQKFGLEDPAQSSGEIVGSLNLDSDKKADVMISIMGIFHTNIVSWTTRSYEVATWALSAEYAVVSYFYVREAKLDLTSTIVLSIGLLAFGTMTQLYLRAAARAHFGNRLAISKCEAALGLYRADDYLAGRTFFIYSTKMLTSTNLGVIRLLHAAGTTLALILLCLVHATR